MGFVGQVGFRPGFGPIYRAEKVDEPAGFTGRTLTVSYRSETYTRLIELGRPDLAKHHLIQIARNGRTVYASKQSALRDARRRYQG